MPPELLDFKVVMNSVLQECATTFALELLEEVSLLSMSLGLHHEAGHAATRSATG